MVWFRRYLQGDFISLENALFNFKIATIQLSFIELPLVHLLLFIAMIIVFVTSEDVAYSYEAFIKD